jgi:uncharacterized protein (TIGR00255 family)
MKPPSEVEATLSGMTGFAEDAGEAGDTAWLWEARSVNGRGLDLRCRLPAGLERLEPEVRRRAQARFTRGAVSLNLRLEQRTEDKTYAVNRPWLDSLLDLTAEYDGRIAAGPPHLEALLAVPGVVSAVVGDGAAATLPEPLLLDSLDRVLSGLDGARRLEGAALAVMMARLLDEIASLVDAARATAETQPDARCQFLTRQVSEILQAGTDSPAVDSARLTQELALLAVKGDIREELDRLDAHVAQARVLVVSGAAAGRRLDFLCQEFNREANTLCAKAQTGELTAVGLDLKQAVDRLREQAQNVE